MSTLANTHWSGTIYLNVVRVISATITLVVIYLLGRLTGIVSGPSWANVTIINAIFTPAVLLFIGVAVILTFRLAGSMGVPFMKGPEALMALMMIVFIAVGDPMIWVVRKYYPNVIPVQSFNIINLRAVMLVTKETMS
jgi:hypothetical protein